MLVRALGNLNKPSTRSALAALVRTLATANPGGEPVNEEAKRQLLFFTNSLYNSRLATPPSILTMRSLTSFTPYYAEDVEYTYEALKRVEDEVDLQNLLTSLYP